MILNNERCLAIVGSRGGAITRKTKLSVLERKMDRDDKHAHRDIGPTLGDNGYNCGTCPRLDYGFQQRARDSRHLDR